MMLPLFMFAQAAPLADAIVYVIRHGEKPAAGSGLSPQGQLRSKAYATYFKTDPLTYGPMKLTAIFATDTSKNSNRPILTVTPLSLATGLKIHHEYADKAYKDLASDLQGKAHGNRIVVCWHHGKIPDLLHALGVKKSDLPPLLPNYPVPPATGSSPKWPSECYDRVVELQFDHHGKLKSKSASLVFEKLLPGDEKGS